jgi:hypothetical protein
MLLGFSSVICLVSERGVLSFHDLLIVVGRRAMLVPLLNTERESVRRPSDRFWEIRDRGHGSGLTSVSSDRRIPSDRPVIALLRFRFSIQLGKAKKTIPLHPNRRLNATKVCSIQPCSTVRQKTLPAIRKSIPQH